MTTIRGGAEGRVGATAARFVAKAAYVVVIGLAPVVDLGLTVAAQIPGVRDRFAFVRFGDVRRCRTGMRAFRPAARWLPAVTAVLTVVRFLPAVRRRRALVAMGVAVALCARLSDRRRRRGRRWARYTYRVWRSLR